ncbi:MAG: hypothetical protein ACFCUJ_14115 [Thiotrichales bacterium]
MNESIAVTSERSPARRSLRREPPLLRSVLAVTAAILALYPILLSGLWLVHDFTRLSIHSPNLDPATQVADFNDFAYIGGYLATHHFAVGLLMVTLAMGLLLLATYLMQIWMPARTVYWVGGLSLPLVMFAQWIRFEPINFLILAVIGATLWLTIGWEEQERSLRPETETVVEDDALSIRHQLRWLLREPILRVYAILVLVALIIAIIHIA